MLTDDQLHNLKTHAKGLVDAKKQITENLNSLIKGAQKLGYSVNPKTGQIKQL